MPNIDEHLPDWSELSARQSWQTLLIGNGISRNLWSGFSYESLFDKVVLSSAAAGIFNALKTSNFETALECVHHARIALKSLSKETGEVDRVYTEIRDALFLAVVEAHIPWERFPDESHKQIAMTLDKNVSVFTTNYDLCLYWSHMRNSTEVFMGDFFWNGTIFDPKDVGIAAGRTAVYYLHGAVHMWQDDSNVNGKWSSVPDENLLELGPKYPPGGSRRPLFVSEGTSESKLRTIRVSPYLSFCLDALTKNEEDTVVLGSSLGKQDEHIAAALNAGKPRRIAVSIYPSDKPHRIIAQKAHFLELLDRQSVEFFKSTTHPLGVSSLKADQEST
jgi:hypothetical protein